MPRRTCPCHCHGVNEFSLLLLKLRRLLRRRGNNLDDADDLIQEAFLRLQLYCREHTVQQSEAFLVRTALNLSTDLHRHQRHSAAIVRTLQVLQLSQTFPAADDVCACQERLRRMKAGIEQLSPRRREVFVLNRIEGYSFPQIAERLGITLSMVEKHAAKAVLLITDWMDEGEQEAQPAGSTE